MGREMAVGRTGMERVGWGSKEGLMEAELVQAEVSMGEGWVERRNGWAAGVGDKEVGRMGPGEAW